MRARNVSATCQSVNARRECNGRTKTMSELCVPFQQSLESRLESTTLGFRRVVHMLRLGLLQKLEGNIPHTGRRRLWSGLLHLCRRRHICRRRLGLVTHRRDRSMIHVRTNTDRHRRMWVLLALAASPPITTPPHTPSRRARIRHRRSGHRHERDCKHRMNRFTERSRRR